MHQLPSNFNAAVFVGRSVELVCFAKYSIYVHLNESILTILNSFTLDGVVYTVPLQNSNLMSIVGHVVFAAEVSNEGDFSLTLDDGIVLVINNVDDNYESYTISVDGSEIFV